ncbi:MAG: spore germination protein [Neobacillus sp.]|jgi:hypothetical protein
MVNHVNNIFGIRVNSISTNGSMNFGNVLHKGHQGNVKLNTGYYHAGDANLSPLQFNNKNYVEDHDVYDQVQKQL